MPPRLIAERTRIESAAAFGRFARTAGMRARESISSPSPSYAAQFRRHGTFPAGTYLFLSSPVFPPSLCLFRFPRAYRSARFRSRKERRSIFATVSCHIVPAVDDSDGLSLGGEGGAEEGRGRVLSRNVTFGDVVERFEGSHSISEKRLPDGRERREGNGSKCETDEYSPEQVLEGRDGGRLAAVVLVAVDVQHPFAADGEHAREDALLQAGAEDDRVVLLIHVRAGREADRGGGRGGKRWLGCRATRTPSALPRELPRVSLLRGTKRLLSR